jgi:hypothetical protein
MKKAAIVAAVRNTTRFSSTFVDEKFIGNCD